MAALASLAVPNFRRWFLGQTLSSIGAWFHTLALALVALDLTGRGAALGIIVARRHDLRQPRPVEVAGQVGAGDQVAHLVLPPVAALDDVRLAPVEQRQRWRRARRRVEQPTDGPSVGAAGSP